MKRLAPIVALLLCGCPSQAHDGYRFGGKEFERLQPAITIVLHPSAIELRDAAPTEARQGGGRELMAWSVIRPAGCEVHIVDPAKQWEPEWIGHEVAHCAWGRWHQ